MENDSLKQQQAFLNLSTDSAVGTDSIMFYFTTVASIFLAVLCFFGCLANVCNMIVFMKIGFKDSVNVSLFGLSVTDVFNNITSIFYAVYNNPLVMSHFGVPTSTIRVALLFVVHPHLICVKISTIITAFIAFERCLCVALPMKVRLIITPTRAKRVILMIYAVVVISCAPVVYSYRLGWNYNPVINQTVFGISYAYNGIEVIDGFLYFEMIFNFSGPYIFVSVCTIILLFNLITKSNWRKAATKSTVKQSTDAPDKDTKVVKMVVFVSILFILCTLPVVFLSFAIVYLGDDFRPTGSMYRLFIVLHMVAFICDGANATCNSFIYYNSSTRYRTAFQRVFAFREKQKS